MAKKATPKGKIAAASLNASAGGGIGEGPGAFAIEQAMNEATSEALARGIVDNDHIREIKLAARERAKGQLDAEGYDALVTKHATAAEKARKAKKG